MSPEVLWLIRTVSEGKTVDAHEARHKGKWLLKLTESLETKNEPAQTDPGVVETPEAD